MSTSQIASVTWTQLVGSNLGENTSGITIGTDSSIYITGYSLGTINGLTDPNLLPGGINAYIAKYDLAGNQLWTRLIGTSISQIAPQSIATQATGDVYAVGAAVGTLDGQSYSGSGDAFIVKYDAAGTRLWSRLIGTNFGESAFAVSSHTDGGVVIGGTTSGNLNGQSFAGGEGSDGFLLKLNADGTGAWTRLIGSTKDDNIYAVTTDTSGSIYVAGRTAASLDNQSYNGGFYDGFIAKYDTNGAKLWTKLIGSSQEDGIEALTIGDDGSIYAAGATYLSLDGQQITGTRDAFVAKYSPDGDKVWTRLVGSTGQGTIGYGIANDGDGNVLVTGLTSGSIDGQTYNGGSSDGFITSFSDQGVRLWSRLVGTSGSDYIDGAVVDSSGVIYLNGTTTGTLNGQPNLGSSDVFLTKWGNGDLTAPTIAITSNVASLRTGENAALTFTLSEASTDFAAADVTVSGGAISGFAGSGTSYTATFTPSANSTASGIVTVGNGKFSDAAGNQNSDGSDANNSVTILVDTRNPLYNLTNDHYYKFVSQPASWADAFAIASASSYRGLHGYLATVTSAQENSFLQSLNAANPVSQNYIWLGGTDNQVEGTWKWTGGPEQGSTFFQAGNSALNANNYGNWNSDPQPNVWSSGEDYLVFYASHHSDPYGSAGSWTDSQDYTIAGTVENGMKPFFIEYGGLTPTYTISASSSSVNEGSSVTFSVNTVNVEWGTAITYTITGIGQSDLASGSLTGTATVNQNGVDGRATVTVNLANDQITEGAETLTLTVSGQQSVVTIQDTSITPVPICFARGTLIHAANQAIPVESLTTGSTVQNKSGGIAQCRWIGYQRRTSEFAQFQDYLPVKISAGAVDDNVPIRDLFLSPDHAVLIDGHLIHAKALVNGKTIVQMTQWSGDIEYYHIETEAHEIIYAEGVPCETFIDNVSREQFDNYAEYQALYPNTRMMKELPLPRVKFKRQLPLAIKQRLESRISELDKQKKG